jgi:TonB-dependent SusC/RagA subfamily outer membrane receptor
VLTAPVGTLSELLNGRVPGLVVSSSDGSTGAGSTVSVRGGGQPLLVIDGVRADNDPGLHNPAAPDYPAPARFDDLDPSEIAQIEILPGPSATALYGPDAGDGVILVTTKHASSKGRGFLTAEGAQVTTPIHLPDNFYAWGHQGGAPVQCLTYLRATGQCTLDSVTHFNPLPPTLETVYQDRLGASVEGTSPTQRLWLGGHYANDPGTLQMPGSDASIYTNEYGFAPARSHTLPNRQQEGDIRGSFGIDLAKTTDAAVTLGYVSRYQRDPSPGTLLQNASAGPGYAGVNNGWYDSTNRPWNDFANVARENARHVNGGVTINWRPKPIWATHITGGVDAVDQTSGDMSILAPSQGSDSAITYDHTRLTQYTADAGATLTVGDSVARSQTTFGLQYLAEHFRDSSYRFAGFPGTFNQGFQNIAAGSQDRSAYAREVATLADHLVLAGGARYDNQRLHAAHLNSWTLNPSFDVSWAVLGSAADPRLRIRGAMGQTTTLLDARQLASVAALDNTEPSLPPIHPERQREWETGFDASLPHDRFTIGLSVYSKRSIDVRVPFDTILVPQAITSDRGLEFETRARLIDRPTFGWNIAFDASQNTDKVLRMTSLAGHLSRDDLVGATVGHPLAGVYETPYTYSDANNDGVIEPNEVTVQSIFPFGVYIGPAVPSHLASASTSVEMFHRHLRLATLFDYRGGYALPDIALENQALSGGARAINASGASLADQAAVIAIREGGSPPVQHVTALRWRELSATVGTPGVHSMQLTLAVRNLRLWTHYQGDPDWLLTPTQEQQLPEPRTWLLRLTAGF